MDLRPDIKHAGLVLVAILFCVAVRVALSDGSAAPRAEALRPRLPHLVPWEAPLPVAVDQRATAPEILASVDQVRPPWSLGLRLRNTYIGRHWTEHRALIEDASDGVLRTYAIGDLLPYASVLVGVSTGAAELTIADEELIRIDVRGRVRSVHDFRTAYERTALRRAAKDVDLEKALVEVLGLLRSEDTEVVQEAIDALVDAGSPAVGVLVPYVESVVPVATSTYSIGASSSIRPRVYGDVIVGVLQAITGQSFGDPSAPGQSAADRAWIRAQWTRWFGLPSPASAEVEDRVE